MKMVVSISTFLFVGIFSAIYIGFGIPVKNEIIAVDKEVEGLNEKYIIKFSHVVAGNTPKGLAAAYFAEIVKEKSNGTIEVQLYPNGIFYNAQEEFDALKRGDVQIIAPAFSEITLHDPKWAITDLPYLFIDESMVQQAFEGNFGKLLFESLEKKGFKTLAIWDNGFKQLTNNQRPIVLPNDMAGLSFRVMPSEMLFRTYELLGATATTYPFNDVYNLLRENKINGQENTISNIYSKGFYQQQKYMSLSNHNYLGYAVLVQPEYWDSLPERYQRLLIEALQEVTLWIRAHAKDLNHEMLDRIISSGIVEIYEQSEYEKKVWREVLKPVYQSLEIQIGEELMNEVRALQMIYVENSE